MGRGSGTKGKHPKGAGNPGGASDAAEPVDVSLETRPRHYTFVGKAVPDDESARAAEGKQSKGNGKRHAKDASGKTQTKGGGKSPGKDVPVAKGTGKSPGKDGGPGATTGTGKAAGKDGGPKGAGKVPGKDGSPVPKGTGKVPGKDASPVAKGTGKAPAGKDGVGEDGPLAKGTGKSPGKTPGKDGCKTGGKDGGATRDDGGKANGKDGCKGPGKAASKDAGVPDSKTKGTKGGNTKGVGKQQGKPSTAESSKGKGAGDQELHTPVRTSILGSPNTGTPPSKPDGTKGAITEPGKPAKGAKGGTSAVEATASSNEERGKGKALVSKGKGGQQGEKQSGWKDNSVCRRVSFDGGGKFKL
ncbi:unnamed protein product [Symbiodinium sp. CCMP2456]|nr:unnamed protein product [Symbiodinium sp. CCMP2456]